MNWINYISTLKTVG